MSDKQNKIMLDVIKRNGRKVDFDASKIALAIKKGFDDVNNQNDGEESKTIYTSKDVNKVYLGVLKNIEKKYKNETRIKIEEIQDLIEIELDKQDMMKFKNLLLNIEKEEHNQERLSQVIKKFINF